MVNSQQRHQKCLLAVLIAITRNEGAEPILVTAPKGCHSRGIINTITDGSASARIYRCSISPGSGKGIVLNINHDIVPQEIGNTLIGVSTDKE